MPKKKKPKPAERALVVYRFEDDTKLSQPLVETALACIRQWVALENISATTEAEYRAHESACAKLRQVAVLSINAEASLFVSVEGGRKGGLRGSNSKSDSILTEANKRSRIGTGEIAAIAKKTNTHVRTVRDALSQAQLYAPQKKGK